MNSSSMSRVSLEKFDPKNGLQRGRSKWVELGWYLLKIIFFLSPFPWPHKIKVYILKTFGAKVGVGVIIKPRVNIHFPWKLEIGNHVWIGEEVFILNFEKCLIEDNVCVSQRSFLCCGNHNYKDPSFSYMNGPIILKAGSWIGAQSFVGPNVVLEENCVLTVGSVASKNLPSDMICSGNPAKPIKSRW